MVKPTICVAEGALMGLELVREFEDRANFLVGSVEKAADVASLTVSADALIVALQQMSPEHIEALGAPVQVIGRAGVGLDSIDLESAAKHQRSVVYEPYYASKEVADHCVAMMLAAHRQLSRADTAIRAEGWPPAYALGTIPALDELSLGVLGIGRIGQLVIERMRPFVAAIHAYDPDPVSTLDGVNLSANLEELLQVSDLLTLHLPLTSDTRHIIGANELTLLPQGALLVNVSRGGLVDEAALAAALTRGDLRAAALDVFREEPLESQSPLRDAPNLLLSPHMAWFSASSGPRLTRWIIEDTLHYLEWGTVIHGAVALEHVWPRTASDPPGNGRTQECSPEII